MRKILLLLFITSALLAQKYNLTGNVKDSETGKILGFANIRIDRTTKGTAANLEGKYSLKLTEGNYKIIASYIGYKSDSLNCKITENQKLDFHLIPISIKVSEVTVTPGTNPAYDIIRKTIKRKKINNKSLIDYKYSSYTKGIIKTTNDIQNRQVSITTKDTGDLKITGILENESRGFYKAPDLKKHFIVARKQTANTPPFINVLTGGTVIQSFYEDNLTFIGKSIPSPISEHALTYYYYYIEKEIAMDKKKVYQIYFNTDNTADPGFYGKLFIEDSTFNILKVDANLNQMANPGGLFSFVKVLQQFSTFDNISLPTDYRLFAEGNYLGLAKFGFELHTIMNSYEINNGIDDDIFDSAIISVVPNADKKNEIYWKSIQSIPNTHEEQKAYVRIDSIESVTKSFGHDLSFFSSTLKLNNNLSISGPLDFYSFNKVNGNTLNFNIYYSDAEEQRLKLNSGISYGFADKLLRKELYIDYLLGNYRSTKISINTYDKITDLFSSSINYNKLTSTVLSLLTKFDFRDYYYTKGLELNINSEVLPFLSLGIGYINKEDQSAKVNSDFSFFNRNKKYSLNSKIFELQTRAVSASIKIDFRKYIEDGFFKRRIRKPNHIIFEGSMLKSSKSVLQSDLDFSIFKFESYGSFTTSRNWLLKFHAMNLFGEGPLPFQMLYALPGNINAGSKNNSFRTLKIGEYFGDKITTLFLEHSFQDDLFKFFQIPILKELQLQFSTHLNMAISDISSSSKNILKPKFKTFKKPFYELGFKIGHPLIPLAFEFTWKLNNRGKNNFALGLNTVVF